jgi:hypothetical protein
MLNPQWSFRAVSFLQLYQQKMSAVLSYPMHATCHILLHLIVLNMFAEKQKEWCSSSCSFLQSFLTSSHLVPISSKPNPRKLTASFFFFHYVRPSFTPKQDNWQNYFLILGLFSAADGERQQVFSQFNLFWIISPNMLLLFCCRCEYLYLWHVFREFIVVVFVLWFCAAFFSEHTNICLVISAFTSTMLLFVPLQ